MKNAKIPGLRHTHTINTIFCIGRNYAEHAKELNNPIPSRPVVFTKPLSSITFDGGEIIIPSEHTKDVHHEAEMVVAIGKYGKFIKPEDAMDYISGYGIGVDVTARDVQSDLKSKSQPWDLAKGLDTFAPIGNFVEPEQVPNPDDLTVKLSVNGEVRQSGNTADMMFKLPYLISFLSTWFSLNEGDLIFTGTPSGVGKLQHGDHVVASLGGNLSILDVSVKEI